MADFSEMISQLLSSEEGKQKVSQVLAMLGQGGTGASSKQESAPQSPENAQAPTGNALPDLSGLLAALQGGSSTGSQGNSGLPSLDMSKLLRIQQLLSQRKNDSDAALLRALKPHLAPERGKKVEEAIRILELLNLLPLLQESGLFGSLLGGEST